MLAVHILACHAVPSICTVCGSSNVPVAITDTTFWPGTWNTQCYGWNLMDGITGYAGGNTPPGAQATGALFQYIQVGSNPSL